MLTLLVLALGCTGTREVDSSADSAEQQGDADADTDADTDVDTSRTIFEDDFEDGMGKWIADREVYDVQPDDTSDFRGYGCVNYEVSGGSRVWGSAWWYRTGELDASCGITSVARFDVSGAARAALRFEYTTNTQEAWVVRMTYRLFDDLSTTEEVASVPGLVVPGSGTLEVDLANFVGWSDRLGIELYTGFSVWDVTTPGETRYLVIDNVRLVVSDE